MSSYLLGQKLSLKSTFTLVLKSMVHPIGDNLLMPGNMVDVEKVLCKEQLEGNPPSPRPPKSHTRPQCKSYILLPCYKMYEVGTDREK